MYSSKVRPEISIAQSMKGNRAIISEIAFFATTPTWFSNFKWTIPGSDKSTHYEKGYNSLTTSDEIAEFANSVDLDEVAQHEPPHLDLHCLPSSL